MAMGGRRQGWWRWLLGLRLLMSRRDYNVRMLRRLHRLLMLGLRMVRLGVQHPSWYRRWRQLLILHSAAHPIISRAHLIILAVSHAIPPPPPQCPTWLNDKSPEVSFHLQRAGRRARIRDSGDVRDARSNRDVCIYRRENYLNLSRAIDHRGCPPVIE